MSYRITIDGDPFCASNFEDSQILNPKVTLEVNKSGSLVFTMLPNHPYYDKIEFRQSLFDVYLNDELIFEGIPVSESTDFFNRRTVTCEGELTFLNDTIQRQAVYQNQTVQTLLGAYLSVHNAQADADKQFAVGAVTVDGGNGIYRYTNFESTMKEIQDDLVENFGGYFRVRHADGVRYLDYLESSPHTSSQTIRIGKNLVDFSRNLSSLDICTVLIPLGAKTGESVIDGLDQRLTIESVNSGKDYLVGTAQAFYGNVWKTHVWDDVTTAAALKTKGQAYLDDVQWTNLVISATAIDLGLAVDDVERFHVLDMIRVVSEPHGLDRYFLLSKLELALDHPANTRITLGQDQRLSLSARTAQISGDVQKQQTTLMVNASESARKILESATGGNIFFIYDSNGVCTEMRILDTADPATATKWWVYNINGWGYRDENGNYTAAATMDGTIYANLITAGTLSGVNIIGEQGTIGGWTMTADQLGKTGSITPHTYTAQDLAIITNVLSDHPTITEEQALEDYPWLDVDGDGHITTVDLSIVEAMELGHIPNGTITSYTTAMNASTPYGLMSASSNKGAGFSFGVYGAYAPMYLGRNIVLISASNNRTILNSSGLKWPEIGGEIPNNKVLTSIGAISSKNGTQISLATGTWKDSCSMNLSANKTYMINGIVSFASNNSGYRRVLISATADSSTPINQWSNVVVAPANGLSTRANVTMFYRPSAATTIHLNVYQNSGSSLNTTGYLQAMIIEG